jgi:hypothetical protein
MWGSDDRERSNRFSCLLIAVLLGGFWLMVVVMFVAYLNRS